MSIDLPIVVSSYRQITECSRRDGTVLRGSLKSYIGSIWSNTASRSSTSEITLYIFQCPVTPPFSRSSHFQSSYSNQSFWFDLLRGNGRRSSSSSMVAVGVLFIAPIVPVSCAVLFPVFLKLSLFQHSSTTLQSHRSQCLSHNAGLTSITQMLDEWSHIFLIALGQAQNECRTFKHLVEIWSAQIS